MIRIILSGCNGAMGQVITKLVSESDEYKIVAGIDISETQKNHYPVYKNPAECHEEADVIIDFSHPDSLEKLLSYGLKYELPLVIATTGLSQQHFIKVNDAAKKVPIFSSANMSLGVNLLIDLVTRAAKLLENSFDIEIIEKHHNQKIDAPSGTALAIADAISSSLSQTKEYVYDRHSIRKKRAKSEIGIHAVRGGTIVGEHTVIFAGNNETIEIKHQATSKDIFAVGALKAATFIIDKEPRVYNMKDLVNDI